MPTFRLTKLMEVWRRVGPQSDFEPEPQPVKIGSVYAEVVNLSGAERVIATQVYGSAEWRITCRRTPFLVDAAAWLLCDGFRYEIRSVVEMDDQYLQIFASRLPAVAGGDLSVR